MEEIENENQEQEKDFLTANEVKAIIHGEYIHLDAYKKYYIHSPQGAKIIFNNIEVVGLVNIEGNVVFNLTFDNCNLPGITFTNCHLSVLIFSNSTATFLSLSNQSRFLQVQIKRCHIDSFEIIDQTEISSFNIQDQTTINQLTFHDCKSTRTSIKTNTTIVNLDLIDSKLYSLYIQKESAVKTLTLYSNNNIKSFYIVNIEIESFYIIGKQKIDELIITKNSHINTITLRDCNEIKLFTINDSVKVSSVAIYNCVINTIQYDLCQVFTLNINEASTIRNLIFDEFDSDSIRLSESNINSTVIRNKSRIRFFEIGDTLTAISNLKIDDSFIQNFTMCIDKPISANINSSIVCYLIITNTIFPKDSYVQLADISISNLKIENTSIAGSLIFNGINPIKSFEGFKETTNPIMSKVGELDKFNNFIFQDQQTESLIRITNSDLGKTQLINFNIREFNKFEYKNSKMLDVFVADTEFPARQNIFHPDEDATPSQVLEQQRLALGQFKKIYENRGDNIRATQALAEEVETYRAQLKLEKPSTRKERWNNRTERFNLWLNRISNYHGNNWFRAMLVTLGVNSLLFMLYSLSIGNRPGMDVGKFFTLAAYSLEFLNPLRKADFLKHDMPGECEGLSVFIDYLSRIIIAYFVYQTIAAFRKFGKKSG